MNDVKKALRLLAFLTMSVCSPMRNMMAMSLMSMNEVNIKHYTLNIKNR